MKDLIVFNDFVLVHSRHLLKEPIFCSDIVSVVIVSVVIVSVVNVIVLVQVRHRLSCHDPASLIRTCFIILLPLH